MVVSCSVSEYERIFYFSEKAQARIKLGVLIIEDSSSFLVNLSVHLY